MHKGLEKAVSALAVQNITEKIGLADFCTGDGYQEWRQGHAYADFLDRQLITY